MAKGEFIKGLASQRPYDQGVTEAMLAGLWAARQAGSGLCRAAGSSGHQGHLLDAWQEIYHQAATDKIKKSMNRRLTVPARARRFSTVRLTFRLSRRLADSR